MYDIDIIYILISDIYRRLIREF